MAAIGTPSSRGPLENLDRPVTALHDQALAIPMHDRARWGWHMLRGSVRRQPGPGNLQRLAVDLTERPSRDVAQPDPTAHLVVNGPCRLTPIDNPPRILEQP